MSRADGVPSEVTVPRLHPPVLRFSAPSPTFPGKQLAVAQVASTITPRLFVSPSLSDSFSRGRIYSALLVLCGQGAFTPPAGVIVDNFVLLKDTAGTSISGAWSFFFGSATFSCATAVARS